jgi:hypothetical protein
VRGSYSSASNPTSFRNASRRSNIARLQDQIVDEPEAAREECCRGPRTSHIPSSGSRQTASR